LPAKGLAREAAGIKSTMLESAVIPLNEQQATVLLSGVQQRQSREFELFHAGFYAYLRRFFARVLLDDQAGEALTEAVFLQVWREAESFVADQKVSDWLLQLAYPLLLGAAALRYSAATGDGPGIGTHATTLSSGDLDRGYAALSVAERSVFVLTYELRLCPDEIARITGSTVASVKERLARTRDQLRDALRMERSSGRKASNSKWSQAAPVNRP
jgi:DNA-directed RNA polymerase specialized sigma24 family protein